MYVFYLFVIALSITGFPYNKTFILGRPGSTACPVIGPSWFHCLFTSTLLLSQGSSCVFGGLKGHFNTSGSWKLCYTILFIMFSFTLLNLSPAFSAVQQMILLNKWHQVVDLFEAASDWFKSHLTNISLPLGQIIVIFIKKNQKKTPRHLYADEIQLSHFFKLNELFKNLFDCVLKVPLQNLASLGLFWTVPCL